MEPFELIEELIHEGEGEQLLYTIQATPKLTFSEAKKVILVGKSLKNTPNLARLDEFLKLLPLLDSLEIKGVHPKLAQEKLQNWIQQYFVALQEIQESHEVAQKTIQKKLKKHIMEKARSFFEQLIAANKHSKQLKNVIAYEFEAWSYLNLYSMKLAGFYFNLVQEFYSDKKKQSSRYESLHLLVFKLATKLLDCNPELFEKGHDLVSDLFEIARALAKKYMSKKNNSERMFLVTLEYLFCCLSNPLITEKGIRNTKLGTFLKIVGKGFSYPLENFINYFVKEGITTLKKPLLVKSIINLSSHYLLKFLEEHTEYLWSTVNFFHKLLLFLAEHCIDQDIIIDIVHLIIVLLKEDAVLHEGTYENSLAMTYLQQDILPCLDFRANVELLKEILGFLKSSRLESIVVEQIFSEFEDNNTEKSVKTLGSLADVFENQKLLLSIIQRLLAEFARVEDEEESRRFIVQEVQDIAFTHPSLVFSETSSMVTSVLINYEKDEWIRKSSPSLKEVAMKVLNLLRMIKAGCTKPFVLNSKLEKFKEFWCVMNHFSVQYQSELERFQVTVEINQALATVAKNTPMLLEAVNKLESQPKALINCYESEQYTHTFYPKLKQKLVSIIGSKRSLSNLDYGQLLLSYSIYRHITWKAKSQCIYEDCFKYIEMENAGCFTKILNKLLISVIHEYFDKILEPKDYPKEHTIANDVIVLLRYCSSPNKTIRDISHELLLLFVSREKKKSKLKLSSCYSFKFPYILQDKKVLALSLDLMGCINLELNKPFSSVCPVVTLPHTGISVQLPSTKSAKQEVFHFLNSFISETLGKALYMAPRDIMGAFAFYIFNSNKILKSNSAGSDQQKIYAITNFSISYVNKHIYSYKLHPKCPYTLLCIYTKPTKFHAWYLKHCNKYSSQTDEQLSKEFSFSLSDIFKNDPQIVQMQVNYLTLADSLLTDHELSLDLLLEQLNNYTSEESRDGPILLNEHATKTLPSIFDQLGKVTSGMILKRDSMDLAAYIHYLVWAPIVEMKLSSISAGVFCWEWVMAAVPATKEILFEELWLASRYLFQHGGLTKGSSPFSPQPKTNYISPLLIHPYTQEAKVSDLRLSRINIEELLEVELALVEFLDRQFYPCLVRTDTAIIYIARILLDLLSLDPNNEGLKMETGIELMLKVLDLCLKVSNDLKNSFDVDRSELQIRAMKFFLESFSSKLFWCQVSHPLRLNKLYEAFVSCYNTLLETEAYPQQAADYFPYFASAPFRFYLPKYLNKYRPSYEFMKAPNIMEHSQVDKLKFETIKELTLIFIEHEYERIVVWNCPTELNRLKHMPVKA